jgi:von Willebrand factor A domain-containing protein 7
MRERHRPSTARRLRKMSCLLLLALMQVPNASWAFDPPDHVAISGGALTPIEHDTGERTRKFKPSAIQQVVEANNNVDIEHFFENDFHFLDERLLFGSQKLLDLRQEVIDALDQPTPDGEKARESLGTALHLIQDFYAHSNWAEMGHSSIEPHLGVSLLTDPVNPAPCPNGPGQLEGTGLTLLTTAYYNLPYGCTVTPGKCAHGYNGIFGNCPGIAKDPTVHPFHGAAARLATTASHDFVEGILNSPGISGDDDAVRALMGGIGTFGFVIDDTGSMGSEINTVKGMVRLIVAGAGLLGEEPAEYLLERFGDPDVGPPVTVGEAGDLFAAVDALEPHGGDDCPELAQSGLLQAVAESKTDSVLFLFTDASAKDSSLADSVNAAAQKKRVKIVSLLTGSCSPIDPAYIRNADETGGQLFFLSTSELSRTFDLVKPFLTGDFAPILMSRGTLAAGASRSFDVPVDSTVSRAVVSLSLDVKGTATLLRPSGAPVASGEPGVLVTQLSRGTIFTVQSPEAGRWQIRFTGSGSFSVDARGNTSVELLDFAFVKPTGAVLHPGLVPITGQPVAGLVHTARAEVGGDLRAAAIHLLDPSGAEIGSPGFAPVYAGSAFSQLVGEVAVPAGPFRVAVQGLDAEGHAVQRIFPALFRGRTLEVLLDPVSVPHELIPGTPTTVRFTVKNFGSPATFRLQAAESHGFVTRVQPAQLSLGTGAEGAVEVDLRAPEGTPEGVPVILAFTAVSTGDAAVSNSATVAMVTGGNRPPDCAAAAGRHLELWPPNHKMVDVDLPAVTGIIDPDGDPVRVAADAITQDEPVRGLGDGDASPDGAGLGTGKVGLRAERAGDGNGRVYRVAYTASDGRGGSCQGSLRVDVPHARGGASAVDDGQAFDSTRP